jgi:patatin-like phospholipase/acyl hydrolase
MRRVLSIDGGGIKGVFPAAFLTNLEQTIGRPVADYFDLIVGTSTGGIIALGLGLGFRAQEILELYQNHSDVIFPRLSLLEQVGQLFSPKYNPEPLRGVLRQTFQDRKLGNSRKRLVIPSFNLETGQVHNWKTSHHPRLEHDFLCTAVDVAMSTAAAPTYFPTHRTVGNLPLIDGGVWANNPIAVAVVEAVGVLKWPASDVRVLSLGCTFTALSLSRARFRPVGVGYWATRATDLFLTAQSTSALGMSQHLVPDRNQIKRINPLVGTPIALDNTTEIPSLVGLGNSEARSALPSLRELFFNEPVEEQFIPFHSL